MDRTHVQRRVLVGLGCLLSVALAGLAVPSAVAAGSSHGSATTSKSKAGTLKAGLWRPNGTVKTVVFKGKRVYIGGEFTQVVGPSAQTAQRANIVALNRTTGALIKSFHPRVDGAVNSIAIYKKRLYLGGEFSSVNGKKRRHLAAVKLPKGHLVNPWRQQVNGPVNSLLTMRGRLYVGGNFTKVAHKRHVRLAALLAKTSKTVKGWPKVKFGANGPVYKLAAAPGRRAVLVGGHFHQLVKKHRVNLGAVTTAGKLVKSWKPKAACTDECPVRDLAVSGKSVYAGLDGPGGRLRAYRYPSGKVLWNVKTDGEIDAVAVSGSNLLIGGHFATAAGLPRKMFAELTTGGTVTSRVVSSTGPRFPGVLEIAVKKRVALVGGSFTDIAGQVDLAAISS
jgi:hypothetical protein